MPTLIVFTSRHSESLLAVLHVDSSAIYRHRFEADSELKTVAPRQLNNTGHELVPAGNRIFISRYDKCLRCGGAVWGAEEQLNYWEFQVRMLGGVS